MKSRSSLTKVPFILLFMLLGSKAQIETSFRSKYVF